MVTVKRKTRSFTSNSLDHQCHSHHRNTQLALENAWLAPRSLHVGGSLGPQPLKEEEEEVCSGAFPKRKGYERMKGLSLSTWFFWGLVGSHLTPNGIVFRLRLSCLSLPWSRHVRLIQPLLVKFELNGWRTSVSNTISQFSDIAP